MGDMNLVEDSLLQITIRGAENGAVLDIWLSVSGTLITGRVASPDAFAKAVAKHSLIKDAGVIDGLAGLAGNSQHLVAHGDGDGVLESNDAPACFVNLIHARIVHGNLSVNAPWVRVRVNQVGAWGWGTFDTVNR